MLKANLKINLLLSGAILIALASSAFAGDPQKDDLLNPLGNDSAMMDAQYYGKAAQSFDPNTGSFSTAGFTRVGLDSMQLDSTWIAVSYKEAMAWGSMNSVAFPPPGNTGLNSSANPGTMGRISGSSHTPSISTPSVWIYTPSTPVIPRNISAIISMLPKYQIILGSDFVKRAPDKFLASVLSNVISQIVMSYPSISMPGKAAAGMPESSLIAVVTPSGIGIYAPANPGINTSLPANASMAPSVQLILGPDYMKLAGPGFVGISVGELQATAPITGTISLAVLKSTSQLPGYMGSMPDSSFITVAITPTTAIYIPGGLNNNGDSPRINSPLAVPHSAAFAIMPEIGTATPLANADVENLLPEAKATPVTQIILSADQIKFEGNGFISINAGDIKATAPAADMTQLPDSPFIAVAITSTEAVYMPQSQTITLAKDTVKSKGNNPINQPPADTLQISWEVAKTAQEVPSNKTAEPTEQKQINKQEANKPDKEIPVENSKKSIEKPAAKDTNKPTKTIDVKSFISKINKAIVAKSVELKAKQTIAARKLTKIVAKQARNIAKKTASFVIDSFVTAKDSISDAQKTIAKFIKFVRNAGNNAAGYLNKLIKGLIQYFKLFGPNEETPVFILDRNTLPIAALDQRNDPLGPPLQRTQVEDLSGDPVPFGAIISRAIPNRINNANMFFVDIIKKNAVNYTHTGLSPPQTVSINSTALLSASKGSVSADSAFVTPACFADFSLFSVYILNKTVSLSLLNAYAFNFKARDFCLFNNLLKNGGSHD